MANAWDSLMVCGFSWADAAEIIKQWRKANAKNQS